jgi:hypothetical protein
VRNMVKALVLLAAICLLLPACGGDSTTPSALPTPAPTPVPTPDSRTNVLVVVGLHKQSGPPTVLEASLRFDGVEIGRFAAAQGTDPVGLTGTATGVQSGRHTIEVVILAQTMSPSGYLINGSAFVGGEGGEQIFLQMVEGVIATGQSLTVSLDI